MCHCCRNFQEPALAALQERSGEDPDDHTVRLIHSDIYFSSSPRVKDSHTAKAAVLAAKARAQAALAAGATCSSLLPAMQLCVS